MRAKADLNLKATNFKMTLMVQLSRIGEQYSSSFSAYLLWVKADLNLKATNFKLTLMVQLSRIGEQYSSIALVHIYCELKLT